MILEYFLKDFQINCYVIPVFQKDTAMNKTMWFIYLEEKCKDARDVTSNDFCLQSSSFAAAMCFLEFCSDAYCGFQQNSKKLLGHHVDLM